MERSGDSLQPALASFLARQHTRNILSLCNSHLACATQNQPSLPLSYWVSKGIDETERVLC